MFGATFFDLFCGAGGLTFGLRQAGWTPLLALDRWEDALRTYRGQFVDHPAICSNIAAVTGGNLLDLAGERPDWIVGGPPCQGFSTIGKRRREDPRNALFLEFARLVAQVEPKGVLIENVLGLRDMNFVEEIQGIFGDLGYHLTARILTAADFGVPQLRRRIIFAGTREASRFAGPVPTHRESEYVTVWEAIGDLPELAPGEERSRYNKPPLTQYQDEMRRGSEELQGHQASRHPARLVKAISFIPDGGNRRHIPDEYQPRSGYHNSYSRLYSGAPAVAVTQNMGKPSATRCIHPFQNRALTAREGARLQTFPDRFHFTGGLISQRLQIANAVPPLLARRIGEALISEDFWESGDSAHWSGVVGGNARQLTFPGVAP